MNVDVVQIEGRRMAIRARGLEVIVDDTAEAGGPGDGFRPSELLMGALGACMMGTMITFARNQGIAVGDIAVHLEDTAAEHPERIGRIDASMTLTTDASTRRRQTLRRVAGGCKIHNTLEAGTAVDFIFEVTV